MIVYGSKTVSKVIGQTRQACQKCQRETPHSVVRNHVWMTLFWVKLFPVSKKTVMRCSACGTQTTVDNAQADAWFPKAPAGVSQRSRQS